MKLNLGLGEDYKEGYLYDEVEYVFGIVKKK